MKKIYGQELIVELFGCDLSLLTSRKNVKNFLNGLKDAGKFSFYGKPMIKRFMGGGHFGEGYSFLQFLSSSSIAGHYIEGDRVVFLNVFSCSMFNADAVVSFCTTFFHAKRVRRRLITHKG